MTTVYVDDSQLYSATNLGGIQHVVGEWSSSTGGDSNERYFGTYSQSTTFGGMLYFAFSGTGIGYFADNIPANGQVYVSIDGQNATLANAVTTTNTSGPFRRNWWFVDGLAAGDHEIVLTTFPEDNRTMGLDYFSITSVDGSNNITPKGLGPGASDVAPGSLVVDSESPLLEWKGATWESYFVQWNKDSFFNGSERCTQTLGASCSLTFNGTAVWYFSDLYSDNGPVNISIDGQFKETVSTRSSDNDTWVSQKLVWGTSNLTPGPHEITLTHAGTANDFACLDFLMYQPTNFSSQPTSSSSSSAAPTGLGSSSSSKSAPVGAIAGGVVGGVAVLALIVCLLLFLRKRSKRGGPEENIQHEHYASAPYHDKASNVGFSDNLAGNPNLAYRTETPNMQSPGYQSGGSIAPTAWTGTTYRGHPEL